MYQILWILKVTFKRIESSQPLTLSSDLMCIYWSCVCVRLSTFVGLMRKSWKSAVWLTSEYMHILYGPQLRVPYSWAGQKHLHTLWASHTQLLASGQPLCRASRRGHQYQGRGHFQQFLWNTKRAVLYKHTTQILVHCTLFAESSVSDLHSNKTGGITSSVMKWSRIWFQGLCWAAVSGPAPEPHSLDLWSDQSVRVGGAC